MSQHVSASLQLDLGVLGSDGTGNGPGGTNYTQLSDESMLKLLTRAFNGDQTRVQHWGTEIHFVGSLPPGYSYWTHPTTPGGTMIPEVFGHPRNIRFRSARDFMRHVDEILHANEGIVRGWLRAIQPNNVHNNNCLRAYPSNKEVECEC